jgi:hypothetical protein
MITTSIILLLVFAPQSRRTLSRMLGGLLGAVGIVFLGARGSHTVRRGF